MVSYSKAAMERAMKVQKWDIGRRAARRRPGRSPIAFRNRPQLTRSLFALWPFLNGL
jgi:hypothetical protein